jgi:hypothetical protein
MRILLWFNVLVNLAPTTIKSHGLQIRLEPSRKVKDGAMQMVFLFWVRLSVGLVLSIK